MRLASVFILKYHGSGFEDWVINWPVIHLAPMCSKLVLAMFERVNQSTCGCEQSIVFQWVEHGIVANAEGDVGGGSGPNNNRCGAGAH